MPVEENVAAIFCPIWPDFPIPVTITFPLHFDKISTASQNVELRFSDNAVIAFASSSSTLIAELIILSFPKIDKFLFSHFPINEKICPHLSNPQYLI